jgi:hypothetical protein
MKLIFLVEALVDCTEPATVGFQPFRVSVGFSHARPNCCRFPGSASFSLFPINSLR